jgi:ethanolamine ammonia-lyase small subunit
MSLLISKTDAEGGAKEWLAEVSPALAARLRSLTPARVGLRRAGNSVATGELLDFQLAHARARDAVHAPLQPGSLQAELKAWLAGVEVLLLHSAAATRQVYLQRPDLGRRLDEASRARLHASAKDGSGFDLGIVIADGLSALAVERHVVPLLADLMPVLSSLSIRVAPIAVVEQGRVAVGDEIAFGLNAELVIVLIGERPGLSSPDSLGAYITWKARPGETTDAERNCISNIRMEGLSYAQAAGRLVHYVREARSKQLTGVALKDPGTAEDVRMLEAEGGDGVGR